MIAITCVASAVVRPSDSARSCLVQVTNPRVSLRKLITAAAGSAGMMPVPVFVLLLAIFNFLNAFADLNESGTRDDQVRWKRFRATNHKFAGRSASRRINQAYQ